MLVFLCRASKSRRNAPPHSSNSVMPNPAFFCAQTWLLVVWTSQQSTGLFSSILQMIQKYEALSLSLSDSNKTFPILISQFRISHQEYIHRVGRTARGEGSSGHALLILRPEELGFLRYLKQAKVPLNEFEFSWNKVADIQLQVSCTEIYILHLICAIL